MALESNELWQDGQLEDCQNLGSVIINVLIHKLTYWEFVSSSKTGLIIPTIKFCCNE